ncbi:MAG: uracil-DNA glycosylase [Dehalococcoidia bacterium]|nr:uracil-DNA glycosylase [Dehalococcoidia bacterium]
MYTSINDLKQVGRAVSVCVECSLSETRNRAVPGEGPTNAQVLFVGEAPGYNEDMQGKPFVGRAGTFLNELLKSVQLERGEVFITNIVKCRPPNNRDPEATEIAACKKYLDKQIELLEPKIIVTLGKHSLNKFLPGQKIGLHHGKSQVIDGQIVLPLYHPAAALHNGSLRNVILNDFKEVRKVLNAKRIDTTREKDIGEQLNLF